MHIDTIDSELGELVLAGSATALYSLDFGDCRTRMMGMLDQRWPGETPEPCAGLGGFRARVLRYLEGDLEALEGVATESHGTAFEEAVWAELRQIEPGTTVSYGELAQRLGRPGAARAVGRANSRNPIALVVPCHRVIGGDGSLTGYAGGLERKKWLLRHEGRYS
jgi:methylated-DNA-[protein]-cysteine S-methyltransferase